MSAQNKLLYNYLHNYKPLNIFCFMEKLFAEIKAIIADFTVDAEKCVAGNKAAGVRARKASHKLDALLKEFRKASVAAK